MIFSVHFALIMFGYCSNGLLLGRYMILYGGATDFQLGPIFMIHPLAMFARPIICARADRYQSHKQLLCLSVFFNSLAYTPFIAIPYIQQYGLWSDIFNQKLCFWLLICSHTLGSLAFCGVRSLGDALALNYAKRVGENFGSYRKFGALGYGGAGFLIGLVNQSGYLPHYVTAVVVNVLSLFCLSIILYNASDHYFVMFSEGSCLDTSSSVHLACSQPDGGPKQEINGTINKLAYRSPPLGGRDERAPVAGKLGADLSVKMVVDGLENKHPRDSNNNKNNNSSSRSEKSSINEHQSHPGMTGSQRSVMPKIISTSQQVQIFFLLMKYDIRIPLFFALLFLGGLLGYAPPNYVFTYMDVICKERGCDSAYLSGLAIGFYCIFECAMYIVINRLMKPIGHAVRLQITLLSLAIHFLFYGLAMRYVSPYFFLMEALHGVEYSISLTSSCELGYKFANEVSILMPELTRRGIIGPQDDPEMVRLCLLATMNSCFTLLYEGAGTVVGVLIYGFILDRYSFEMVWLVIGASSVASFFLVPLIIILGRCLNIRPKIRQLASNSLTTIPSITYS